MVTQPVYYITPQADQVFGSGQDIQIGVNITSNSSRTVNVRAEIIVYEGSINPTHGTELARYESAEYALTAGETHEYSVTHSTVVGSIDRRDVGVVVHYYDNGWKDGPSDEWDDVYYVQKEGGGFDIGSIIQPMIMMMMVVMMMKMMGGMTKQR